MKRNAEHVTVNHTHIHINRPKVRDMRTNIWRQNKKFKLKLSNELT